MMSMRYLLWPLGLMALGGCGFMVRHQLDREIRDLSALNDNDLAPCGLVNSLPPPPPSSGERRVASGETEEPSSLATRHSPLATSDETDGELQQAAFEQKDETPPARQRLVVPKGLPGADAPDIEIPTDPEEKERYFAKLYPPVPSLPPLPPPAPGPEGRPLNLADLQRLGETYSPTIKTALAAVEAAKAAAYQAGMYPNPEIAYEHDTVETGPAGYPGGYFEQLIKTGGKLTVKQAAATMDVLIARLALRRAKADLWTRVRSSYFAVLVARIGVRYSEALFQFAEFLYEYQIKQLRVSKLAAGYEPMQLRPLVLQARFDIIQARNKYAAAWRQLAAAIGLPDMPPSQLAGSVAMPMPVFDYDAVLSRLVNHTDVRTALVSVQKAKYNLRFQKLVPLPDVGVRALVQKDYTTPPNQIAQSAVMYMKVPLWNQNQGGIRQAEWQLAQAAAEPSQARLALIAILADAYRRYVVSRQQVDITQQQLRDLLRAYKSAWLRHQQTPMQVSFSDLWPVQSTLEGYVSNYVAALGDMWQAAVDVANLLQTPDFFQSGQRQEVPSLPVLEDLLVPLRNYPRAPLAPKAAAPTPAPLPTVVRGAAPEDTLPPPTALAPPQQPAYVLPPPSWPTFQFPQRDPLLDRPNAASPGWYANVETDVLFVHLRNQLGGPVTNSLTGMTDFVKFAGNPLEPTLSPRFEVGYRLPNNWGGIQLGYRFLTTQGSEQIITGPEDDIQALAHQVGILNFNLADLTYVSREFGFGPYWLVRWGAGARMLFLYFNSGLQFLNPGSSVGSIFAQNESNSVSGGGVWAFLDLERKMPLPGLALFGRLEATDLEAQIRQGYSETVIGNNGAPLAFKARYDFSVGVPILREVAGISYTVPQWNYSRFLLGAQWETFFQVGRDQMTNGIPNSRGQLDLYGLFLRAEFHF